MRNGFKFNERHSSDFGVTVKTKSRPLRPSVKTALLDLPCRDGAYDFSKVNSLQRELFNERTFVMELSIAAENIYAMQNTLSALSLWLGGGGNLIFDDLPLVIWSASVSDEIIYMPEHGGSKAVIEASFRAKPFGRAIFDSDGPVLGCEIRLGEKIPIGLKNIHTYTVSGSGTLTVYNWGDRPATPIIEITGAKGEVTLSLGESSLSFTAAEITLADFEKQRIEDADGGNITVSGEFFEFPAGRSELLYTGTGTAVIHICFNPGFMYNMNTAAMDWGGLYA